MVLATRNFSKEPPFLGAVLVSQSDAHAVVERNALRNAGFRHVTVFTSGVLAAEHLSQVEIKDLVRSEIVLCQMLVGDMNSRDFLQIIRAHPLLIHQPLIGVGGTQEEAQILLAQGYNTTLSRPLTGASLDNALIYCARYEKAVRIKLMQHLVKNPNIPSLKLFHDLLDKFRLGKPDCTNEELTVESALELGMHLIKEQKFDKALVMLSKATVEEHTRGDAFTAMAAIYRRRGMREQYGKSLFNAISAYATVGDEAKLYEFTKRYSEAFPETSNPLLKEINKEIAKSKTTNIAKMLCTIHSIYSLRDIVPDIVDACMESYDPKKTASLFHDVVRKEFPPVAILIIESVARRLGGHQDDRKSSLFKSKEPKKFAMLAPPPTDEELDAQIKKQTRSSGKLTFTVKSSLPNHSVSGDNMPVQSQNNKSKSTARDLKMNDMLPLHEQDDEPLVPMFDEGEIVYLEKNPPKGSKDIWNIIKGTASMFRSSKS